MRRADVGEPKVDAAAARLAAVNPDVALHRIAARVGGKVLDDLVAEADVVVDCCDNFATRHAVNRACVTAQRAARIGRGAPLRRPGRGVRHARSGEPVLPLPVRRRRRAGGNAMRDDGRVRAARRHRRRDAGRRGAQAPRGRGRIADRAPAAARCARHAVARDAVPRDPECAVCRGRRVDEGSETNFPARDESGSETNFPARGCEVIEHAAGNFSDPDFLPGDVPGTRLWPYRRAHAPTSPSRACAPAHAPNCSTPRARVGVRRRFELGREIGLRLRASRGRLENARMARLRGRSCSGVGGVDFGDARAGSLQRKRRTARHHRLPSLAHPPFIRSLRPADSAHSARNEGAHARSRSAA